ncbi:MAG: signal peptidase I [Bradymonadales bacterium]
MESHHGERGRAKLSKRAARKYLKEATKLYKRAKKRLHSADNTAIAEALVQLKSDIQKDGSEYVESHAKLQVLVDKYLSFAKKSSTRELFESLAYALLFALLLRAFIIEPFKIPTRSMVPTLLDGDQLFVTKLSYGIRLPIIGKQIVQFSRPKRGDVIVFVFPRQEAARHLASTNSTCMKAESLSEEKDYIKRVIGVEGDTIEIIDQVLHVNGEPVERRVKYVREVSDYFFLSDRRNELWNQERLGSSSYMTITHEIPMNHFGPVKVKAGHLFVMGDNRDNSADSRCWGQVPLDNVKGKAQVLWWSSSPYGLRFNRMFTVIR